MTTAAAAKIIGCTDGRVRQLLRDKVLVGERTGRDWLVSKVSAEEYALNRPNRGPKPGSKRKPKKGKK